MKTVVTPLISLAVIAMLVASFAFINNGQGGLGIFGWCLLTLTVFLATWLIAMLLNFAIFAPVYWLLGRLQSKKDKKDAKDTHDA